MSNYLKIEDESILLRIRRQYTKDECINELLKIIDDVRFQNGVLKSELAEAKFEINKIRNSVIKEGTKTKKEWLKDDLIIQMTKQMHQQQVKNTACNKSLNEWRNKYCSLIAQQNNNNG